MSQPAARGPGSINVADVVDRARIGAFQIRLFALCALCLIMDGFDVQVMSYVGPAIVQDWDIPNAALGPVFGIGNLGVLVGALVFTMVADTIGRRPVLVSATLFFSVLTLLTSLAESVEQLLVLRFITGVGLGCIIPNATALIGEYSPQRLRITLMMVITVGFTAGAALGGLVSAWLIPTFGWQSVFYFGGAVPLVIGVLMWIWLPESLQFLVVRRRNLDSVGRWLSRIDPSAPLDGSRYVVREEHKAGVPVRHLFGQGRGVATIVLWIVNFMNILVLYSLSNWLPTMVRSAGYETSTAVLVGALMQTGGTLGTFAFAWLIARLGFISVLMTSFAIACVSIASIGPALGSLTLLSIVAFIAGWCIIGAQPAINAMAATVYPTYLRSTGIGWGLGIGRIGGIVGPVLGGLLLGRQWSATEIFAVASLPALASLAGVFCLRGVAAVRLQRDTTATEVR